MSTFLVHRFKSPFFNFVIMKLLYKQKKIIILLIDYIKFNIEHILCKDIYFYTKCNSNLAVIGIDIQMPFLPISHIQKNLQCLINQIQTKKCTRAKEIGY